MAYKIAVATSDGQNVDLHFGAAKTFTIYEVEDGQYHEIEKRAIVSQETPENAGSCGQVQETCDSHGCASKGCGPKQGCGNGGGGGCGGSDADAQAVEALSDCRCIVCRKIGFRIQKQLERKAISSFDVDCSVEEALQKISFYYKRVDSHCSLRRSSQ